MNWSYNHLKMNHLDVKPHEEPVKRISGARRLLAQVTATTIGNIHQIDSGFSGAMPAIVIAALSGTQNELNSNEPLSMTMTADEASWMGSIAYLILPLCSFSSGFISDFLGRKKLMICLNIPFLIGWIILYQATQIWQIFFAVALQTMAVGFVKSTVLLYCGEVCDSSIRSSSTAYLNISSSIGMLVAYILNTLLLWRSLALIGVMIPFISAITLVLIPETPQWLLSKNCTKDAENSLRWLRGWVPSETVAEELKTLQQNSEQFQSCSTCVNQNLPCSHPPPTLAEKLSEFKKRRALKPFLIIFPLFFLTQFSGIQSLDPFHVQIFKAYNSPIAPESAAVMMRICENVGHVLIIFLISYTGKRRLFAITGAGAFFSSLVIACYGFICLPSGLVSFGQQNQSYQLANPNFAYIPTFGLFFWCLFAKSGFLSLPWLLIGEIFPFKIRGVAIGVCASINYGLGFISKKTYYNLETLLSMPGVTFLYSCITGIGLILMYFILPETEGRTLEDIERHFSNNSKRITDWKIDKSMTPDKHTGDIVMVFKNSDIATIENNNKSS